MHTQTPPAPPPATPSVPVNTPRTDDGAPWIYTTDACIPTLRSWRAFFADELHTRHRMGLAEIVDLVLDAWICWAAVRNALDGTVRLLAFPLTVCLPGTPLDRAGYTYGYQIFDERDVVALAAHDREWRRCPPRILAHLTPVSPTHDPRVAAWRALCHIDHHLRRDPQQCAVLGEQGAALLNVLRMPAPALPATDTDSTTNHHPSARHV